MSYSFFVRILLLCLTASTTLFAKYDVAISAIFQDEAPYLEEWIEFHKLQGVQHFYLYNNNSSDDFMKVLKPYIKKGDVTLTDWSYTYDYQNHSEWIAIQAGAYMDTIKRYGNTIKWLAAIDIDEFLFCPTGKSLVRFLKKYKKYGGLCVNWKPFGTSNISDIPKGFLQIEMLIYATNPKAKDMENYFVKSIVQPKYVKGCSSAHCFEYVKGRFHVDVRGHKLKTHCAKKILIDKIRINHYWTRTTKYLWDYKIASRLKRRKDFSPKKMLRLAAKYNKCIDTAILQHVGPLRLALQNKRENENKFLLRD